VRNFVVTLGSAIIFFAVNACTPEPAETPTKGNLHLLIAESVAPAAIAQVEQFMAYYRQNGANVTFSLVNSDEAVKRFTVDTTRTIIVARALHADEREAIQRSYGTFLEMIVAYDAVAVIVHPTNAADEITFDEIRKILAGKTRRWEQLQARKKPAGTIRVFLQDSSDISSYLTTRLLKGPPTSLQTYPRHNSIQLIDKVVNDPLAIGFVGLSWIDSAQASIKTLRVSPSSTDPDTSFPAPHAAIGKFFSPHPAYIHQNSYPLKRAVYMYSKSLGRDLAAGFSSFVATFEGQRIFLSHGLVPGTQEVILRKTR